MFMLATVFAFVHVNRTRRSLNCSYEVQTILHDNELPNSLRTELADVTATHAKVKKGCKGKHSHRLIN